MTWLLTDDQFVAASDAMRVGDVTPELYAFLHRVTRAVTLTRLVPPVLSPTGQWDAEAAEETLHSWLVEKLLVGGLVRSFHVCGSPRGLARYLEQSLKNWLISMGRSRSLPRLVPRTRLLLTDSEAYTKFIDADTTTDQWWGLTIWDSPAIFQGTESDLASAAFSVADIEPLRYRSDSTIADPVVSTKDLDRLITGIFVHVGTLLTLGHFDSAFRARFAPWFQRTDQPIDTAEDSLPSSTIGSVYEAETVALRALADLTGRQVRVLSDRYRDELTLEQIAAARSISRGTADNELKRAQAAIRVHILDDEEFDIVVEKILEIAFEDDGDGS